MGIDTGEWGGRGSVDRYDWEGRRRVGTDRGSGVGGGESWERHEEWGWEAGVGIDRVIGVGEGEESGDRQEE